MPVTRASIDAATTDPLIKILERLERIERLLQQQLGPAPRSSLSRNDRSRLALLLPVIAGVFGSERFTVRELFDSEAAALQVALRGVNAKQVGRLLRRARGQPVDGYLVQHDGTELHVNLWRVFGATA